MTTRLNFKFLLLLVTSFLILDTSPLVAQDCGTEVSISTEPNSSCLECNYEGPTILINELMISPSSGYGSLSGEGGAGNGRGEWIELYNPNWCDSVDISCYYLGNSAPGNNIFAGTQPGGYVIPEGTIVPPLGFAMVRGSNAAPVPSSLLVENGGNVVELVVPFNPNDPGTCIGGGTARLWFPNTGGWFAFYDAEGNPQDAVRWGNPSADDLGGTPCIAQLAPCNFSGTLASYNNIPASNKNNASSADGGSHTGQSIRRFPDGGDWSGTGAPTYATCNDPNECLAETGISSCNGTATVTVTNGTGPYTYQWNDPANQTNANALNLCVGDYELVITDGNDCDQTFEVSIIEDIFTISAVGEDPTCGNTDGSISVTVDPANTSYTYNWSANTGVSDNSTTEVTDLSDGTYSVTVSGGGCEQDTTITLESPDGLQNVTIETTDALCDETNGNISVTNVEGGTAPYSYELVNVETNTDGVFSDLSDGTYSIVITDENNCTYEETGIVILNTPDITNADFEAINTTCAEDNGSLAITNVDGGTPNYNYNLENGLSNSNGTFNDLPAGTYSVTIEDSVGCTYQVETIIIEPSETIEDVEVVSAPATCNLDDGIFTFQNVTGGVEPYTYAVDGIAGSQQTYDGLGEGVYTYTITDDVGCEYSGLIEVPLSEFGDNVIIPNVITANNDNVNDFWFVTADCVKEFECVIINRWGNKVYEYFDINGNWDGKDLSGTAVTEGVYFYLLKIVFADDSEAEYHGNITVVTK